VKTVDRKTLRQGLRGTTDMTREPRTDITATLLAKIRDAFPVAEPPLTKALVSHPGSTGEALQAAFRDVAWTLVPAPLLEESVDRIALFTPAAFAYYLPAFMSRAVIHPWNPGVGPSAVLDFTVQSLCDEDLPTDPWWAERMPHLAVAQRRVVRAFLEWVCALPEGDDDEQHLRKQARSGLERYWSRAAAMGDVS
jgi:hypothetical protein